MKKTGFQDVNYITIIQNCVTLNCSKSVNFSIDIGHIYSV